MIRNIQNFLKLFLSTSAAYHVKSIKSNATLYFLLIVMAMLWFKMVVMPLSNGLKLKAT